MTLQNCRNCWRYHKYTVPKPPNPAYPAFLATLGNHGASHPSGIRERRLELALTQKQAAKLIGIDPFTVLDWERGNTTPPTHRVAPVIEFLGYPKDGLRHVPYPGSDKVWGTSSGCYRKVTGLTQRELAAQLGVDPGTIVSGERGKHQPIKRHLARLNKVLRDSD